MIDKLAIFLALFLLAGWALIPLNFFTVGDVSWVVVAVWGTATAGGIAWGRRG